jgi:hypothetical protein
MLVTASTGTPEETVRVRLSDLAGKPQPSPATVDEAKTTRIPSADMPVKPLPKAVSAFDGMTVRLRPIDMPVIGTVAKTVRQRYVDLRNVVRPPTKWDIARVMLVMLLASMPILAISVEVFGIAQQSTITMVTIVLVAVLAGMVACIVYDGARLFAVHVLHLMGDFIPVMGSFVTGEPDTAGSAAVGYVCRYIGDAGGLGVAFFVVAFALGIDRWKSVYAVLAAVGFAVFPTWAGLMATVALSPNGEERMFPLNTATVIITLVGHLIFGLVLGLAFLKAPRGADRSEWPWPPILETAPVVRVISAARKVVGR